MKILGVNNYYVSGMKTNANSEKSNFSSPILKNNLAADTVSFSAKMDAEKKKRMIAANGIIHSAAAGAATAAASMAQMPGADTATLTAITTGMALSLCRLYNINSMSGLAVSISSIAVGKQLGTDLAMKCVSWIPGIGNAASATSTFLLHEATGWSIVALLENQRKQGAIDQNQKITKSILDKYKKEGKELKDESKATSDTTFKGSAQTQERFKQAKSIMVNFTEQNDLKDKKEPEELSKYLTNRLCDVYDINKNSQTAQQMNELLISSNQKAGDAIGTFNENINEHLFDLSYATPFMALTAVLEDAKMKKSDVNNLVLTPDVLSAGAQKVQNVLAA